MPRASSLGAAIEREFGVASELVRLSSGIFNVWVDGKQIWDKKARGRFPEESEILAEIGELRAKG